MGFGLVVGYYAGLIRSIPEVPSREGPANFPIEQWQPGLTFDEVRRRAEREGVKLSSYHTEGNIVVHKLGEGTPLSEEGSVLLGFCRDRLVFVRHNMTPAAALHAFQYLDRIAGRPAEIVATVSGFVSDSTAESRLRLSWPTDTATITVTLSAMQAGMGLVETLAAHDTSCPTE